ncbi:major facilitator superfamily domain-containing protein [Aspergillus granulosus]|uniref:Major facilitator superfamily domain-containing protein n=1 Tax=Aspergillus granulosus TaxID=176169 RepID=A0ABR4H287_9EURO
MPTSLIYRLRGEDPQSKVGELIRKYRSADNSSLAMIFNNLDSYGVLINALRRQINLVKCRSHEFEDCQITVYDKALLILSNYGDCVTDPGVLGLYLTEFLGVVPIAPNSDGNEAVASHVELESILERRTNSPSHRQFEQHKRKTKPPVTSKKTNATRSNDEYNPYFPKIHRAEEDEIKYSAAPDKEGRSSVRVARLLDVYHQAKEDYFKIRARDGVESLPAVKFLRDSAENTLRYLHSNGLSDHVWVRDLEETFAISRDKTAQLLGGRKRHFDEDHKRHYSEDYKGKQRGYKRARRVVDSYRPKLRTDFGTVQDQFSDDDVDEYNYDDEARPKFTRPRVPKYTEVEEQQIVKKLDRRLVPFLALLYLLSFLDRSNIGNAKIAGLMEDLKLSSSQYEWLLTAFYITYILFEWMTLLYRVVPAHIYISLCVCGWGLVASFQSLSTGFGTMVFLRAVLGITEAAFGPGVPFYLSLFYKREELAFRTGLFVSAAPLASSFASSLAWLIVKSSSDGPIAPWRTLFLVEGFPSIIVAVFAWFVIPDSPGTATFLEPRQRMIAQLRMGDGGRSEYLGHRQRFNWGEVGRTLADPKSYITAFMFFSCNVAFSSMPVFLPTILQDMGYTPTNSQALSAPPYLLAFLTVLLTSHLSDRTRTRSPYLIALALLSSLSYALIALTGHFHSHLSPQTTTTIRYICVYPATAGFFSAITLIITWSMDNRVAKEGKGASVAILNIIGQCGPLLGTRLYPAEDGPWYVRGMGVCAVFMGIVAVLAVALRFTLQRANARQAQDGGDGTEREREVLMLGSEGIVERKGDDGFTYII